MKISLIHGKYFNSWEALGLGYIGAYLKTHTKDIEIDFFQGCFDSDEAIIKGCSNSDLVAFSCTTPTFSYAVRIARLIKRNTPSIRTVVGGYHASSVPRESLVEGIDQAIVGEGEAAMLDIVNGNRNQIVYGTPLEFSDLPWPDRKLIKNERNIDVAYADNGERIVSFQSHRGCPYACKYCSDGQLKVMYGKTRTRHRPVCDLLDEMQQVAAYYHIDLLKFCDPTWNIDQDWVNDFCSEKIRRKFEVPFYPNIHAGLCDERMFGSMVRAGCRKIAVGIESGSPKILKQIGKGTTVDSIRRCIRLAKSAGLTIRGYFILGMPEETKDDLRLTEHFAEELDLDEYGFSLLCPYPGTELYDAKAYADVNWDKADEYANNFWHSKYLDNQSLREQQTRLTEKFKDKLTWHHKAVSHETI